MPMRDMLKKLAWPLLPKPWHSPYMETRYGLWSGISALYTQSGRQLGESNTRPFLLNHRIPAETVACKYEGSRAGRAINVSTLRVAMRHFDEALAITAAVRRHHLDRIGAPGTAGLWDLLIIARASIAINAWRQRVAGHGRADPVVPDALASQYQFIAGIFMICRDMMGNGDPVIAENRPVMAETLYAYADAHGIFLSPGGMACAGSTRKIVDFMACCVEGAVPGENGGTPVAPADLRAIVTDPERCYAYALATVELDCLLEGERLRRRADDDAGRAAVAIHDRVRRYCAGLPDAQALPSPAADVAGAVLARQNAILALLGRPPVRRIPARILAERLG